MHRWEPLLQRQQTQQTRATLRSLSLLQPLSLSLTSSTDQQRSLRPRQTSLCVTTCPVAAQFLLRSLFDTPISNPSGGPEGSSSRHKHLGSSQVSGEANQPKHLHHVRPCFSVLCDAGVFCRQPFYAHQVAFHDRCLRIFQFGL
ncbi:hypothetical protein HDV57DRAFT_266687 [Trichoderma longibrachiatum]|uniref:Uncharacterized protein n=1 Tax=Trichoderma longibrachiatum ATCC 18648 TaxID=983965 RepID=A0A2T4C4W9_TRILO|nr:hypothetical protein M440DRAFT_1230333 [Trichoderma longibrachiatum ATCC 18648]